MVTNMERRLVWWLLKMSAFEALVSMRLLWVDAKPGFGWLLSWLKTRQKVDPWHHAPCCPANHYHRQRLVFQPCTCGAAKHKIK